jgi:very-short-patch-repair endonuclease
MRTVLHDAPSMTRSEAERCLLRLLARARLPRPHTNVRLGAYEVDAHWPAQRLVVEVDGYAFHSGRAAFERDRLRDMHLQLAGLRVMRVTWRQLVEEPEALAARLGVALASPRAD